MVIAVDFDGTCVTHEFPEIGKEIGAALVLKCLFENGNDLILNTMRSTNEGHRDVLREAGDWFAKHDIPLYGANINPDQKDWTSSPKVYAHLYIDDAALGIPLLKLNGYRPFVDWITTSRLLFEKGLITGPQLPKLLSLIIEDLNKL